MRRPARFGGIDFDERRLQPNPSASRPAESSFDVDATGVLPDGVRRQRAVPETASLVTAEASLLYAS